MSTLSVTWLSCGISLLITFWCTRISISFAKRFGIIDRPGEIKIHTAETPRFGGIGIVLGVFCAIQTALLIDAASATEAMLFLLLGLPVVCTGMIDDIRCLAPKAKLAGQMASCLLAAALVIQEMASFAKWICLWVLGCFLCVLTNSINLLDGMDGMAGGIVAIINLFLGLLYVSSIPDILTSVVVAACVGFLYWNRPPAKTFMGDVGSLFLGYITGVNALRTVAVDDPAIPRACGVALILIVPACDTGLAIARRILLGADITSGDRLHIYDCVYMKLGHDGRRTLWLMWGICVVFGLVGIIAASSTEVWAIVSTLLSYIAVLFFAVRLGALGLENRITTMHRAGHNM